EFVSSLFPLLLDRAADASGLRHWTLFLTQGGSRLDLVRVLATSDEAKALGRDAAWLPALADTVGPGFRAVASTAARSLLPQLPGYLSNAAYLPTNVRELRAEATRVLAAQSRLERALLDAAGRQTEVETCISGQVLPGIEQTRAQTTALLARMEAMETHSVAVGQQIRGGLTDLTEWVSLLQKKMELMALDLREHVTTPRDGEQVPEPRVVDPDTLRRKIDAAGGRIQLNL